MGRSLVKVYVLSTWSEDGSVLIQYMCYSKTPLIRITGDQLNLFELEEFRIRGY